MSDPLLVELSACERAVWDALMTGDGAADAALLDAGFLGVYPDGFANRDEHTAQVRAGPSVSGYQLDQIHLLALGPDHAALSYHAAFTRPGSDTARRMYVTSIWRQSADGWRNIFSQDTPARDAAHG